MVSYRYLVVGGGMTGDAVCRGIRDVDDEGTIGLVGEEPHAPYKRPPLTKGLWKGGDEAKIWRGTEERRVELHLGRRVVSIDLQAHRATDDAGEEYAYERLILATGGTPRRLPDAGDDVVYFRTLDDYRRVRAASDAGDTFLVVGGGFIGSEIAAALRSQGRDVTMVFPEPGIGWRTFPPELSRFVTDYYREQGVDVARRRRRSAPPTASTPSSQASASCRGPSSQRLSGCRSTTASSSTSSAAPAAARTSSPPAMSHASRCPRSGAAGASSTRTTRTRTAASSAANTAGADRLLRAPAVLLLRPVRPRLRGGRRGRLAQPGGRSTGSSPNRKGIVAYTDAHGSPRGFLLWNVWDKVDAARELILAAQPIGEDALRELAG